MRWILNLFTKTYPINVLSMTRSYTNTILIQVDIMVGSTIVISSKIYTIHSLYKKDIRDIIESIAGELLERYYNKINN